MLEQFRKRFKNQKGFTLIELIIVILIMGILAAALMLTGIIEWPGRAQVNSTVADYNTVRSASYIYYAENAEWPTEAELEEELVDRIPAENEFGGEFNVVESEYGFAVELTQVPEDPAEQIEDTLGEDLVELEEIEGEDAYDIYMVINGNDKE